jgi:hypothetical protein
MAICPIEADGSLITLVKWKHFSMGQIIPQRREEKKRLQLVYKCIIYSELIAYLKPKFQFFAHHNFVARWQDKMFKSFSENFPTNTLVSVVDFAKNYMFEIQNEVQSMHSHSYQVTILVHISWMKNTLILMMKPQKP